MPRTIPSKTLKNGFSMPIFGLGTWRMGGDTARDPQNDDDGDVAAIRRAIEAGVTHIDTAELYAAGHAETLVGRAIEGLDRRSLFLTSKAMPSHFRRDDLLRAVEDSLRRMQTDYLDLYLLHRTVPPDIDPRETFEALDAIVARGLVRSIGVSNFGVESLRQAQSLANHPIVVNQVHYNLRIREPEETGLLRYCQEHDVLLEAWRPLQGIRTADVPAVLRRVAEAYDKTPSQVALRWLLDQKNVVTLMKTRSAGHLEENLGALDWEMRDEDIELLRAEYPDRQAVSDAVPLS